MEVWQQTFHVENFHFRMIRRQHWHRDLFRQLCALFNVHMYVYVCFSNNDVNDDDDDYDTSSHNYCCFYNTGARNRLLYCYYCCVFLFFKVQRSHLWLTTRNLLSTEEQRCYRLERIDRHMLAPGMKCNSIYEQRELVIIRCTKSTL